ncbi:hypothetical protein BJX61DRAFT_209686 [Aspergillus egyptiacus]|nr:hypothetical protein BJX61DRAFT_209686 [Aspergillus egyptiacus]
MAPGPADYHLPEVKLPPETHSWSFLDLGDRSNIRYEQAPTEEPVVGLGISPDATHARSVSYDDALSPNDRSPSRFADSQTTLFGEHQHHVKCRSRKTLAQGRLSWIPVTIIVLALYSTGLSGLYLVIAFMKPRYGKIVGVDGKLAPSTASLLSTLLAKTVELAYVTVCVAFLGQVLTRRAITKGSRGISIADMCMRTWIMQPGSMIVHWESLRYSGWTILGAITLTATVVSMLYTTAAEALVTPMLKWGPMEDRMLVGDVYTAFANPFYLAENCETPVAVGVNHRNITCLDMQHVGQAYHNYQVFLHAWTVAAKGNQSVSTDLAERPRPTGSIQDNTTVTGSWIDQADMAELSRRYGRFVQNVTAAMPHAGIIAAATHPKNAISQPKDLSGEGNYQLVASVPSPAVNVLCVGMNETELEPLIYEKWPNANGKFDPVTWTTQVPADVPDEAHWRNRTVVDDIFGFGPDHPGKTTPIFGKLPLALNTILNVTTPYTNEAIYMLGAGPNGTTPQYVLCALRAKQTPKCATHYAVTDSGSQLSTICEENHPLQYSLRNPSALDGVWAHDWKNIASEWGFSLSLNSGITDGQSANARLLMQFIPQMAILDPNLPSASEALAVLAGNTLLMSSANAPFVPFWNYTTDDPLPATQWFNASLRTNEYTSGGTEEWQGIFYPILVFAFFTSALCLSFMLLEVRGRQVTDFTEPQNLFALAVNSPGTARLQGACGAGPEGVQLKERWFVAMEEEEEHYYIRTKAEERTPRVVSMAKSESSGTSSSSSSSPSGDGRSPTEMDLEAKQGESPVMKEYRRLAERKSWLSKYY